MFLVTDIISISHSSVIVANFCIIGNSNKIFVLQFNTNAYPKLYLEWISYAKQNLAWVKLLCLFLQLCNSWILLMARLVFLLFNYFTKFVGVFHVYQYPVSHSERSMMKFKLALSSNMFLDYAKNPEMTVLEFSILYF